MLFNHLKKLVSVCLLCVVIMGCTVTEDGSVVVDPSQTDDTPPTTRTVDGVGITSAPKLTTPFMQMGGVMNTVALRDEFAYIGEGDTLTILDISDPSDVVVLSKLTLPTSTYRLSVRDIDLLDQYAYIIHEMRIDIVDISDPVNPAVVASHPVPSDAQNMVIRNETMYVRTTDYMGGLQIIDISDRTRPVDRGQIASNTGDFSIDATDQYAYILSESSDMAVIDISDPDNPEIIHTLPNIDYEWPTNFVGRDDELFVITSAGLIHYDVTDPTTLLSDPPTDGESQRFGGAAEVLLVDDRLFVADSITGLQMFDVSSLDQPQLISDQPLPRYDHGMSSVPSVDLRQFELAMNEDTLAVIDYVNGLTFYDAADLSPIGNYNPVRDLFQLEVVEPYIYLIDNFGLAIIDTTDPDDQQVIGRYDFATDGQEEAVKTGRMQLDVVDNRALIAADDLNFVIDVSDPADPQLIEGDEDTITIESTSDVSEDDLIRLLDGHTINTADAEIVGDTLYVAARSDGLQQFKIAGGASTTTVEIPDNLQSVERIASFTGQTGYGGAVINEDDLNFLVRPVEDVGLTWIDFSDPSDTTTFTQTLSSETDRRKVQQIVVSFPYAYVTTRVKDNEAYLHIFDITDPEEPQLLSDEYQFDFLAYSIQLDGDRALVHSADGAELVDISDPEQPTTISTLDGLKEIYFAVLDGDNFYTGNYQSDGDVKMYDISDPDDPVLTGIYETGHGIRDLKKVGDYLLVAEDTFGLGVIDVSDPSQPVYVDHFEIGTAVKGIGVQDDKVALISESVTVVDISDPTDPQMIAQSDAMSPSGLGNISWLNDDQFAVFTTRNINIEEIK